MRKLNLKKIIGYCIILLAVVSLRSQQKYVYFDTHCFPSDSQEVNCSITFKMPYDKLVFVKDGDLFLSGVEVFYEIKQNKEIVRRINSSKSVSVSTYEETLLKNSYIEGVANFRIPRGNYQIIPSILLSNTRDMIPLERLSFDMDIRFENKNVVTSIVEPDNRKCNGFNGKKLINLNNLIPFDEKKYDLLITVIKENIDTIKVEIIQNKKVVQNVTLDKYLTGSVSIEDCEDDIVYLLKDKTDIWKTFLFPNLGNGLIEGPMSVVITSAKDTLYKTELVVEWLNKPETLSDINLSAELYMKITGDRGVKKIFDAPSEEYYNQLFEYWKKLDPVVSTSFNELMSEFYLRADIAKSKFKTTDNIPGAKTDRGHIFIKYGEPDNTERSYNGKNKIIEIWKYEKLQKEFVFEDTSGLGNYQLVE